jgi:S-adenosylhomocysteine hydrolase
MALKDYIVKDLSLADWGRKEIDVAEKEMAIRSLKKKPQRCKSHGFSP